MKSAVPGKNAGVVIMKPIKYVFDISFALIGLTFLSPIFLLVCILIKLGMGGPVLFCQLRPGLKGKSFRIYKFRTMSDERDDYGNLLPDEQRLSSVGKWLRRTSLDELPQLINVIRGELSLVGPRPLLMEYLPLYSSEQNRRHEVKPGITGWAQVNGRNAISWEEKFKLDVWYVDHQSFWLDMKILWMTALKVAKREGVNQQGHVTMEKFKGNKKCQDY